VFRENRREVSTEHHVFADSDSKLSAAAIYVEQCPGSRRSFRGLDPSQQISVAFPARWFGRPQFGVDPFQCPPLCFQDGDVDASSDQIGQPLCAWLSLWLRSLLVVTTAPGSRSVFFFPEPANAPHGSPCCMQRVGQDLQFTSHFRNTPSLLQQRPRPLLHFALQHQCRTLPRLALIEPLRSALSRQLDVSLDRDSEAPQKPSRSPDRAASRLLSCSWRTVG